MGAAELCCLIITDSVPVCSGAQALRRITQLLSSARRAESQCEYARARELYQEVLKINRTLARAPLGSIGASLRDVVEDVEGRLVVLQEQCEADGMSGMASTSSLTKISSGVSRGKSERQMASSSQLNVSSYWDMGGTLEHDGRRPATRDSRPTTQDSRRMSALDGTRPSTRDDMQLQQQLDGTRPLLLAEAARPPTNGGRPGTNAGRDAVRPPTRSGLSERRIQDVMIRTSKKPSRPAQGAPEVMSFELASPATSPSPEPYVQSHHADESINFLE